MIQPIRLSHISSEELTYRNQQFLERFSVDPFKEGCDEEPDFTEAVLTEAVFKDGRKKLDGIVKAFQTIKDKLETDIKDQGSKFKWKSYERSTTFRDLENALIEAFGLRNVDIYPWHESYNKKTDEFSSKQLNVYTWLPGNQRYPIDSLVTDDGFYDKTKTICLNIHFSLGVVKGCTAEELTAIFLHEFGHNIDPAFVDIKYIETNILSKYLTDREGKITNRERESVKKGILTIIDLLSLILIFIGLPILMWIVKKIRTLFFNPEKAIEKIRDMVKESGSFNRKINYEAFADNFARMYGFGAPLISGLKKMDWIKESTSRIKREKERQMVLADLIKFAIIDEHKTDIHRVHNLIKEYEEDLKDPKLPKETKKAIETDMGELKILLDQYTNSNDAFRSRINKVIVEELEKLAEKEGAKKKGKDEINKESDDSKK